MRAAFTTIVRHDGTSYIGDTVRSMLERDPTAARALDIRVFSDDVAMPELPPGIACECRTQAEHDAIQAEQLINARNQIRVLRWVAQAPANELVLTFEDDLEFADNWLTKALACAARVKDSEYVMLLSHFRSMMPEEEFDPVAIVGDRTVWLAFKWTRFWGAQAVLMQAGLAGKIADAMERGIAEGETLGAKLSWGIADQGINHYCQAAEVHEREHVYVGLGLANLYGVFPSLANHIGAVSSWDPDFEFGGGGVATGRFMR